MTTLDLSTAIGETGLIWPSLPSYEEWAEVGPRLALVSNTSRWALADWLLLGGDRWPEKADQVVSGLGLAYHSIENLRWVARRVPPSVRRPLPVSFSHHALVAALAVEDQDKLLGRCEQAHWTRDEFRGYLVEMEWIKGAESSRGDWTPAQIETATRMVERYLRAWMDESEWFMPSPLVSSTFDALPARLAGEMREYEATAALIVKAVAKAVGA